MIMFCVCVAFAIMVVTITLALKRRREFDKSVKTTLVGILCAITVLIFPMYRSSYDSVSSGLFSVLYALRALSGCQSVDLSHKIAIDGWLHYAYYTLLYVAFVVAPLFTTSFLISIFGNLNDKIRYRLITAKELHVFSALNESSIQLCESLNCTNAQLIFCNTKLSQADKSSDLIKRARKVGAIILNTSELEIKIKKDVIWFYQISSDKNININSTIELIEKYRSSTEKTIRIITFSSGTTPELLLDSIDKGEIRVKLIDEVKYSCYALLDQKPLFEGAKNKKISALIVGCDYTGMEMLKAVIWCGQLSGYELEINIIDSCANAREKEFARNCPDVNLEKYGIRFIESNVNSVDFKVALDKYCQDTTYVIIAMGSDSLNISTAGFLRKYFLRNDRNEFQNIPPISLRVREGSKCLQMETLSRNNSELYGMTIFGSNEKMFSISNIMSSPLEKMAIGVHLAYYGAINGSKPQITDALKSYYVKEYNQRASFAVALHVKYKLHACGIEGITGEQVSEEQIAKFEHLLNNADILDEMAMLEHERWNAFMRTEGYSPAGVEEVKAYCLTGSKPTHIHHIAKLHPSLVEWSQLDQVSKEISDVMNKSFDFKKSDYDIVLSIPDILRIGKAEIAYWDTENA